jgi:molecular chaperone GrpE
MHTPENNTEPTEDPVSQHVTEDATQETQANSTDEVTHWEEKWKAAQEQYVRLYAEFENFRKRNAKEKQLLQQTAGQGMVMAVLPLLDDLERALAQPEDPTQYAQFRTGIQLIHQKFIQTLKEKGVEEVEALNQPFDPDRHEAITHIPATQPEQEGKVLDVIEKGYMMGEQILRFPKVVIGR